MEIYVDTEREEERLLRIITPCAGKVLASKACPRDIVIFSCSETSQGMIDRLISLPNPSGNKANNQDGSQPE